MGGRHAQHALHKQRNVEDYAEHSHAGYEDRDG